MKKKASLFFMPLVVFFTLVALVNLYIVLIGKSSYYEPIGQKQFALLKVYMKAESALFYIDQSAKYALQQAVYELGQNGGFSEIEVIESPSQDYNYKAPSYSSCGKYYGYSVWQLETQNCIDNSKTELSLKYIFNKNLNQYLERHPHNIPINNYDYFIKDKLVIEGRPFFPLVFYIGKDELKPAVKEPEKTIVQKTGNFIDFSAAEICAKGRKCILSEEAFKRLERAQQRATNEKVALEVTDSYRSLQSQIDEWLGNTPMQWNKIVPDDNLRKKYVCYPYGNDVEQRCSHLSGNAVDVRLKGKTKDTMTREDWQLVKRLMTNDDVDNRWIKYAAEPWHFECCGTKRTEAAKAKGVVEIGEV